MESRVPRNDNDDGSEYAAEGQLLHMHFANKALDRSSLKPGQREVLELGEKLCDLIVKQAEKDAGIGPDEPYHEGYERRLVLLTDAGELVFPGTTDFWRFYPASRVLVVVDEKFGYQEVTSADNNLQLASYSVMLGEEIIAANPTDSAILSLIYAGISQPRAPFEERMTMAKYEAAMFPAVKAELLRIVAATLVEGAPLNANPEACRNCRAGGGAPMSVGPICPDFLSQTRQIATLSLDSMLALPAAEFGFMGDAIKLAAMLGKHWNGEARRRIEAQEMPGWKLKNNGSTSEITDLKAAYVRFLEAYRDKFFDADGFQDDGMAALAFMACLEPRWGRLDELFAGLEKVGEKKARKIIEDLWGPLITKTEKEKSPIREK